MPKRTGPTNDELRTLIEEFKRQGREKESKLLLRLAKDMSRATRNRREVGLSRINRNSKEGGTVIVPGKVLDGKLEKKVNVIAWRFSASAAEKIKKKGGKVDYINTLLKSVPKGARIIG